MKKIGLASAMALAMNSWMDGMPDIYMRRKGYVLPERKQSPEEAQRRLQAAEERRKRRAAKWAGEGVR